MGIRWGAGDGIRVGRVQGEQAPSGMSYRSGSLVISGNEGTWEWEWARRLNPETHPCHSSE